MNEGDDTAAEEIKRRNDAENNDALKGVNNNIKKGLGSKPVVDNSGSVNETSESDVVINEIEKGPDPRLAPYDIDAIVNMLINTKNVKPKNIAANRLGQLNNAIDRWARTNKVVFPKKTDELKAIYRLIAEEFLRKTKGK